MRTPSLGRRLVLAGVVVVTVLSVGLDALLYLTLRANLRTGAIDDAAGSALFGAQGTRAIPVGDLASRLDQQLREADGDPTAEEDVEHGGPV